MDLMASVRCTVFWLTVHWQLQLLTGGFWHCRVRLLLEFKGKDLTPFKANRLSKTSGKRILRVEPACVWKIEYFTGDNFRVLDVDRKRITHRPFRPSLLSLQMTVNVQQWNLNSTSVFNDNNHRRGQIASAGWTTLRTKNCKTGNKLIKNNNHFAFIIVVWIYSVTLLREKFLQFDWLRAVVFQLNLKYLHVKITNLLLVVV